VYCVSQHGSDRICARLAIGSLTSRITWWPGNPSVNETIAGVKFDLATTVLRGEADAGRVGILTAVLD
jgi:hypothetical protein